MQNIYIHKVEFVGNVTTIYWSNGEKTVSVCEDPFADREKRLMRGIIEKFMREDSDINAILGTFCFHTDFPYDKVDSILNPLDIMPEKFSKFENVVRSPDKFFKFLERRGDAIRKQSFVTQDKPQQMYPKCIHIVGIGKDESEEEFLRRFLGNDEEV